MEVPRQKLSKYPLYTGEAQSLFEAQTLTKSKFAPRHPSIT